MTPRGLSTPSVACMPATSRVELISCLISDIAWAKECVPQLPWMIALQMKNTRYYQRYIMSGSICCRICYTYPWFRNTNYAANWLVCSSFSRIACFLSFCFPLYQLSPNTPNIPANKARLLKQIPTIW